MTPLRFDRCVHESRLSLLGTPVVMATDSWRVHEIIASVFASSHFQPDPLTPALRFACMWECDAPWAMAIVGPDHIHVARPSTTQSHSFDIFHWSEDCLEPDGTFTYDREQQAPSVDTTLELFAQQFQRTVLRYLLARSPVWSLVHAGSAQSGDVGVMVIAPTMGGKSVMTVAATVAGMRFLADDLSLVDISTGWLHPFPRAVRLRQSAYSIAPEFASLRSGVTVDTRGEERHYVYPEGIRPDALGEPVRLTHVLRLVEFGPQPSITPASRAEMAVACARADAFADGARTTRLIWEWGAILEGAVAADLVAGPPLATAEAVRRFVEGRRHAGA